ncbi:hypothetical protein RHMOL_Rhmol13G0207900 [Rhododendron molle]|uniref:Uncharacterized protein n=1 Tax=Rhododendron molle TaxID=49168 RepID=A0ACC0L9H6_RHOML|nr:hypothetical protein RHMOL_Rhmol13G0207900 [Rhododendron molle]
MPFGGEAAASSPPPPSSSSLSSLLASLSSHCLCLQAPALGWRSCSTARSPHRRGRLLVGPLACILPGVFRSGFLGPSSGLFTGLVRFVTGLGSPRSGGVRWWENKDLGFALVSVGVGDANNGGSAGKETGKVLESSDQVGQRLSLKSIGNGWLYHSAVAKLHKLISINDLKVQMTEMGLDNIDVKAMGERSVILTCTSREGMEKMIKEKCLQRWFSDYKPWDGQVVCAERFVWLCYHGMPLIGWSNTSFKSIGELWGSFISTDESTLKMSSFAEAKILIATNIFKEIDEWITVEVVIGAILLVGASYLEAKSRASLSSQAMVWWSVLFKPCSVLDSLLLGPDQRRAEEEDEDDEADISVSGSETNGSSSGVELLVQQGSGIHCVSVSGGDDSRLKEANLDGDNQLVADSEFDGAEIATKDTTKPLGDIGAILVSRMLIPRDNSNHPSALNREKAIKPSMWSLRIPMLHMHPPIK